MAIDCDWPLLIDMNPNPIGRLIVDGNLVVQDSMDMNITAESIFIRGGSLRVGS